VKILIWHVHGSWLTSFVAGDDEYLVPLLPDRGPDGRGRARTWTWPASTREVTPDQLREERPDVVVLQRQHEIELLRSWTGLRAGIDLPAVYVEHNTPTGPAAATRHALADTADITIVHVTAFNALMWDCGIARTTVIEHGVPDFGARWTGERRLLGAVVNEPVRRWRVAGTDVLLRVSRRVPTEVYGMGMAALVDHAAHLQGRVHEDLPQPELHASLVRDRAYLHPYRWTSLGLSLVEAMTLGMPVLAVAATAAAEVVPPDAGVVSSDPDVLIDAACRLMADPAEARERGRAARAAALRRFGLNRFLADWRDLLEEVV
jgi:hypothetical protein